MNKIPLIKAVENFISEKKDYYKQWIFDEPIIISHSHNEKLKKLQGIMHRLILQFVNNFEYYQDLVRISDKTTQIIKELKSVDYKVGTYRTDFVYDCNNQPKLIEITCRFALNTLFESSIFDYLSKKYHKKKINEINVNNDYDKLFPYLSDLSNNGDIFVLKGSDKKNASRIFKKIFMQTGKKVNEINYKEIKDNIKNMKEDSFIISELTLDEIESLDISTIKLLSQLNMVNDFRTSLLIHDKQFFSVLENKQLQESCLTLEEIIFIKDFLIPTYNINQNENIWNEAKENKNNWILKHKALGKSESIFAGETTSEKKWKNIFETENLSEYILQKWIPPSKIKGEISGEKYNDYVTGTLLFFNEHYFGLGPFRTSSFPVTNVVDDRKATSLTLSEDLKDDNNDFENYINS